MTQKGTLHDSSEIINRSSVYQEFLAEREEILKHKWLKSESLGRDMGFEAALLDWVRHHRRAWKASKCFPLSP